VVDVEEGYFEFINPVILSQKGEQSGWEGCLSVRGKSGIVSRPMKVKLSYQDRFGEKHVIKAKGFFARAICHELDHLDGVLYIDKASHIEKN
jgi:peptide deformylase